MIVDAFMNSWVVALTSLALPYVFWTSESVKDEILDALGLLFLYGLDDYGSVVGEKDFDVMLEHVMDGLQRMQKKKLPDAAGTQLASSPPPTVVLDAGGAARPPVIE